MYSWLACLLMQLVLSRSVDTLFWILWCFVVGLHHKTLLPVKLSQVVCDSIALVVSMAKVLLYNTDIKQNSYFSTTNSLAEQVTYMYVAQLLINSFHFISQQGPVKL